jgi:hypothetical protein
VRHRRRLRGRRPLRALRHHLRLLRSARVLSVSVSVSLSLSQRRVGASVRAGAKEANDGLLFKITAPGSKGLSTSCYRG